MNCDFDNDTMTCPQCGTEANTRKTRKNCTSRKAIQQRNHRQFVLKNDCIHKGKSIRLVECDSCCGKVNIFEFSCTLHKVCFIDAPREVNPGTKRCITCKDYISTSKEESNV